MDSTKRGIDCRFGEESNTFQLQNHNNINRAFQQKNYVKNLEDNYEELQAAFLQLTSQYARLQFRIRQLKQATPTERETLINELNRLAFNDICNNNDNNKNNNNSSNNNNNNNNINYNITDNCKGFPNEELFCLERNNQTLGDIKRKQHQLIQQLRNQIDHLYDTRSLISERLQYEHNNDRNLIKQNTNARSRKLSRSNSAHTRKSKSQSYVPDVSGKNERKPNSTVQRQFGNNTQNKSAPSIQYKTKEESSTL